MASNGVLALVDPGSGQGTLSLTSYTFDVPDSDFTLPASLMAIPASRGRPDGGGARIV